MDTTHWKDDLVAGTVVFLVALPLCLGIALACGAPLFGGLIAGVVGGIGVTALSHSRLGVSGPAAGLAVIVADAVGRLGYDAFLLAVVIAGALQIVGGFLRLGIIGHYFPSSVIKGMLAGIGIILILKQLPHAVGYDAAWMGEMEFSQADGHNTLSSLYHMLSSVAPGAVLIALLGTAVMLLWETGWVKRRRALAGLPAPLLVVLLGLGANEAYALFAPALELRGDELVRLPVASTVAEFVSFFELPDFSRIGEAAVWTAALTLAVVASIETLLAVEASDKMDPLKRTTPTNRELVAQGAGNVASGLIGGLPLTQVVVRSAANVQAGGRTRLASAFHGVLLLVSVALLPEWLNRVPLSCLAVILILTGYKLARVGLFREMLRAGHWQYVPFGVTVLGLVLTDMLTGIAMGMAVGVFNILMQNYRSDFVLEERGGDHFVLKLSEHVSFLNKAGIVRGLGKVPAGSQVTIDGTGSLAIDADVLEVLQGFRVRAAEDDIRLELRGIEGLDPPEPSGP